MNLSIARLRKFHEASLSAHAALTAANDRWRAAKRGFEDSRTALRIYIDTLHANRANSDSVAREQAKLQRDVDAATQAVEVAQATRDHAHDVWQHAAALSSKGKAYAESMGMLPRDLVEA